ncbi:hypothetical protein FALCPG4_018570 [Fusarium falciforme]
MSYKPVPSRVSDAPFFGEAIGAPPIPQVTAFGIIQGPPQYNPTPKSPESLAPPQMILPTVENDQKPIRRARNRRQSQASSCISGETGVSVPAPESPKRKKRGRKPNSEQPKEPGKRRRKVELDEGDLRKDSQRRRILERNRIAAAKCHLRKRDEASALASREQAMKDQNRYLSTCFDALTAEIYHLKTQLLQHTDCSCVLIQTYITNQAKKTVDGLLSCSSAFQLETESMSLCSRGLSNSGTSPTDSLSVLTPEFEGVLLTWPHAFQQGPASSIVGENMFGMAMDPDNENTMPVLAQPIASVGTLLRPESDIFASIGPYPDLLAEYNECHLGGFEDGAEVYQRQNVQVVRPGI